MDTAPAILRETIKRQTGAIRNLLGWHAPMIALGSVLVFVLLALVAVAGFSFPSPIDELEHLSVIAEQAERPSLFRDASEYRVLSADAASWSSRSNYINHPSLYYLALAPIWTLTESITVLRLVNVAMAAAALLLVLTAGLRLFKSPLERAMFAILAASFPKSAVTAGIINNDNLAACAAAAVFAGVTGMAGANWWMAVGLALAGWTKLTAFIALGTLIGCHYSLRLAAGQSPVWGRESAVLGAGAATGAVPYLVNFAASGKLLYFNADHFRVPYELRSALNLPAYIGDFLVRLVYKWPALEGILPSGAGIILISLPLLLVAWCISQGCHRWQLVFSYAVALLTTLTIQIAFGWSTYREIGDLTIAQTRYYSVLWPGVALAGAAGATSLARWWSRAPIMVALACLLPTLLGMPLALALLGTP